MDTQSRNSLIYGAVAGAIIGGAVGILLSPQQRPKVMAKIEDTADFIKEAGNVLNEQGMMLADKSQEVAGVIKDSISVAKDIKDETQTAAQGVKSEISNFKQS
ncbi:YtxH domain-containing protein [Paenibacillus sp. JX-17]|uniref:YtxH domain-containing protein n=1 Tax=Paenibacillus lacisoli TaxID=3064525 RepID=A0ABT9CH98_9BACL|nr:YtxH domain-containing protein [Paenibacillus sp. JX-17]MDO7908654.1 YtxH domain-containing protein [Paenibacillus sp. JX-17]